MELVKVIDNQLSVNEEIIQELKKFDVQKAQMDIMEKELKKAILEAMEEHNIKKFENDEISITYVAETIRKSIDSNALKEQGLYEIYLKESVVKPSVRITYK